MGDNNVSYYSDIHYRSIAKAITWRILATITTMIISYFITGNLKFALAIGSTEVICKIILYYFHERVWTRLCKFGIKSSDGNDFKKTESLL